MYFHCVKWHNQRHTFTQVFAEQWQHRSVSHWPHQQQREKAFPSFFLSPLLSLSFTFVRPFCNFAAFLSLSLSLSLSCIFFSLYLSTGSSVVSLFPLDTFSRAHSIHARVAFRHAQVVIFSPSPHYIFFFLSLFLSPVFLSLFLSLIYWRCSPGISKSPSQMFRLLSHWSSK